MSALSRRLRVLLWTGLLSVAVPSFAFSQAVVLVLAVGNPSDPPLSQVVARAATVELGTFADISPKEASQSTSVAASGKGPATAEESGADFLLVINYSHQGDSVHLEASLRNAASAASIATDSASVPFDLNLDTNVSNLVAKILSDTIVQSAIKAAAQANKSAKPKKTPSTAGTKTSGTSSSSATAGAGTSGTSGPSGTPRARWAFASNISGTPLILVGAASNYFRYGAGGSVYMGARFPFARVNFETGITAAGEALFPAVGLTAGMVYSALGGLQIRLGTPSTLPVGIGIQAKGGAAVLFAEPTGVALAAKTDIFAGGGLTSHIRLSRWMTLGMELGALVIFEARYPIIALEPVLKVGFSPQK